MFTTQPVGGKLTNVFLAPVVLQVESPIGVLIATIGVPVTVSLSTGSGAVTGTLTQLTDANGQATFSDLRFDQVGTKALRASCPILTPAISTAFRIVPLIEVQWTNGGFMIQVNGTNSFGPTIISASTNLADWMPIYTNAPTANVIQFFDADSTNFPVRFYRAVGQ